MARSQPKPADDFPRVLQFRTAPAGDELDIRPGGYPKRKPPSAANLEAVFSWPLFWIGAATRGSK
jgi:hypothetical protein